MAQVNYSWHVSSFSRNTVSRKVTKTNVKRLPMINYVATSARLIDNLSHERLPSVEFELPELSRRDLYTLAAGNPVQMQERTGSAGTGLIVWDIPAKSDQVFDTLTRFSSYDKIIPTVRSVQVLSINENKHVAEFSVSKFRLKMNVEHRIAKEQRTIFFNLDQSRLNIVLKQATGFWYVQNPEELDDSSCRVWFKATVVASRMVPATVVDYAASRALIRATNWMKPYFTRS